MLRTVLVAAAVASTCAFNPSVAYQGMGTHSPAKVRPRGGLSLRMATTQSESARLSGLALAFDDGTRKSHSVAENSAFVTGFFRGISNQDTFVQLVTSLWFVYDAMEGEFDACSDTTVRAMDYDTLRRKSAIEKDMEYFYNNDPDWRQKARPSVIHFRACMFAIMM